MKNYDSQVSQYIENAQDFAKPILRYCREIIFDVCPDVSEAIKWGIPHYDYKGDFMCVAAAYKNHCSFTFLKADLMTDERLKANKGLKPIQRYLGKITQVSDLPSKEEFTTMLKEAMTLNEQGKKVSRPKPEAPGVVETPDFFVEALKANPKAKEIFESKSPSFRKNYNIWLTDAKTAETRQKRMEQSLEWIAEGKDRFWQSKK